MKINAGECYSKNNVLNNTFKLFGHPQQKYFEFFGNPETSILEKMFLEILPKTVFLALIVPGNAVPGTINAGTLF